MAPHLAALVQLVWSARRYDPPPLDQGRQDWWLRAKAIADLLTATTCRLLMGLLMGCSGMERNWMATALEGRTA